jgi:5-amino-6-(5-phosphoribosylamino)uracil reductase
MPEGPPRPYVLLSAAISIDGRINDTTPGCLSISNAADLDRVDDVRASSDAIMIGAETMRSDNPRMRVKSPDRIARRQAEGRPEQLVKVTVTHSGHLDPALRWFHHGTERIVHTVDSVAEELGARLGDVAEVVSLGPTIRFAPLLDDLGSRGIGQLMVEGGQRTHTTFLEEGLADELHLAVGPLMLGAGPSLLESDSLPWPAESRMHLAGVTQIGDTVLLRYHPKQQTP